MAGNLTAMIASIFSGSAVTADPYYEYTTLLLPGSGTNGAQNNTFLDSSTNNFTITRNGNTTQGTFSPFSQTGWGNYFDGTGDALSAPASSTTDFGTSNFTIEAWVYLISGGANRRIYSLYGSSGSVQVALRVESANTIRFFTTTSGIDFTSTATIALNAWSHIAIVRNGSAFNLYLNGTSVASGTSSSSMPSTSTLPSYISGYDTTNEIWLGYISNLRVVKGTAVYTGAFTPPTSPLAATQSAGTNISAITGTQTSLLTCQSNRFIDNSTNNFTITRNGDTSVVAFSPFNPTASWSAATYGGSGYFDGSGDSLTCSSILPATSDFTLSFWVYPTSLAGYVVGGAIRQADSGNIFQFFLGYTDGRPSIQIGGVYNDFTAGTIKANQWHYIQLVKASSAYTLYVNGTALSVTASNGNIGTTSIASGTFYVQYNTGCYFSDVRVVASALSNTVPTAPLTAITNTSLLLNFTNAGIYDATSKNDLETVGDAQISNAVTPKWGSTSIKFDGTGDWLLIPDQPPQRIGTGKFTIELWVYRNSSGTYGLVGKGTGTTGWLVSLNSSNQVVFTYGSSTITSTGTVSATTWTHIAVVREGTSTNQTKIYINGTNDGTGTVSTDFNQTNSMYIGADRTGGSAANAYVQDVRITNDARYTANFTAPTAAFPTL
jgi:hypothetical protein